MIILMGTLGTNAGTVSSSLYCKPNDNNASILIYLSSICNNCITKLFKGCIKNMI